MSTVEIRVDAKRLEEHVTVDEFIGLQEGNIRSIRDVLGRFVIDDDGQYVDPEAGKAIIGQLTIKQLVEYGGQFAQQAESAVVPTASGTG